MLVDIDMGKFNCAFHFYSIIGRGCEKKSEYQREEGKTLNNIHMKSNQIVTYTNA